MHGNKNANYIYISGRLNQAEDKAREFKQKARDNNWVYQEYWSAKSSILMVMRNIVEHRIDEDDSESPDFKKIREDITTNPEKRIFRLTDRLPEETQKDLLNNLLELINYEERLFKQKIENDAIEIEYNKTEKTRDDNQEWAREQRESKYHQYH